MGKLKKTSFLEGAFIATACIFISKALGILYVIPFKQIVGDAGGALYSYAYNIYNVFLSISSVGIPFAISALISKYGALNETEKKIRLYKIATRIISGFSVLSFAICFIFSKPLARLIIGDIEGGNSMADVVFVIRTISFTLLIVPLLSIKRGFLQGNKYVGQPSISQVVEQLVRVGVILVGSFLCVNVFHLPVRYAVAVSCAAAGLGGLVSFIYLTRTVNKNREELGLSTLVTKSKELDILVTRELILYAVPFVIINLANTLYSTTDMLLILNTLPRLDFSGAETEFISSVFTTWGTKFSAIVAAVATGLIVSLIPHIVSDYTKGESDAVNSNFNKCLKIILFIILPLSLYISIMADSFWTVFYEHNQTGINIIRFTILVKVLDCLYIIVNSLLQSLNKKRIIFTSVLLGLATNLALDVPFMHLFHSVGLKGYYGAILATFIGYALSNVISLSYLNRKLGFCYKETFSCLPRAILSFAVMLVLGVLLRFILPIDSASRIVSVFNIAVSGVVLGGTFLILNLKTIKTILPERLLKKLHLA